MISVQGLYDSMYNAMRSAGLHRISSESVFCNGKYEMAIEYWEKPNNSNEYTNTVLGMVSHFFCNLKLFRYITSKNYFGRVRIVSETYDNYIMVIYQELSDNQFRVVFQTTTEAIPLEKY